MLLSIRRPGFLMLLSLLPAQAMALDCSVSLSDLEFGNVPTLTARPVNSQTSLSYRCNASIQELSQGTGVTLCLSINSGSAMHFSSEPAGVRKLGNGSEVMTYDLYTDAARSRVWGSNFDAAFGVTPPAIHLELSPLSGASGASGAGSRTVFGQVSGFQAGIGRGVYTSSFGPGQLQLIYDFSNRLPDCKTQSGYESVQQSGFNVRAQVLGQCQVSTTPMSFGRIDGLLSRATAQAVVTVSCVNQTPYQIGLGAGNGNGATVQERKLTRQGPGPAVTINYNLYQDASHLRIWGQALDFDTVSAIATGNQQSFTVFGRVPPQPASVPGVYSDTVVVTVTF